MTAKSGGGVGPQKGLEKLLYEKPLPALRKKRGLIRKKPRRGINEIPAGMVTKREVIERTGITDSEFCSLIHRKIIAAEPTRTSAGWSYFREEVINKILRVLGNRVPKNKKDTLVDYSTEQGQIVMKMLAEGKRLDQIYFELYLHPSVLRVIQKEYVSMIGGLLIPKDVLDAIYKLPIDGAMFPFVNASDLLELFENIAKDHQCRACGKKKTGTCSDCMSKVLRKQIQKENERRDAEREALLLQEEANENAERSSVLGPQSSAAPAEDKTESEKAAE